MEQVRGNTYIESIGSADIGIYMLHEREAVLIDSGEYPSKEFIQMLHEKQLSVRAVIQTHMHIDHIGNNEALVREFGAQIIADEAEEEDVALWKIEIPYPVQYCPHEHTTVLDGQVFTSILMPGHSPGHQLIVTPDGVCFLGDVIMSENKLAFAKMPFRRETKRSMESIERLSSLPYDCYVAAHKGVLNKEEMERSARKNLEKEEALLSVGRGLVKEPVAMEQLELAYMSAADVTNPAIQAKDYMHISTSARIEELARRGFLTIRDGIVFPSSGS